MCRSPAHPWHSAQAGAGDLVQRDGGGDAGVERLGAAAIGMRTTTSQLSPHQPGQARALRADHERRAGRRGRRGRRASTSPSAASPTDVQPGLLVGLQRARSGWSPARPAAGRRRRPRCATPRRSCRPSAARDDDAVRAERGRRADDRAEVARVGDAVERDDQRRRPCVAARGRAGRRGAAYSYGGTCSADALVQQRRRSSGRARPRLTSSSGSPRSPASCTASVTRSSAVDADARRTARSPGSSRAAPRPPGCGRRSSSGRASAARRRAAAVGSLARGGGRPALRRVARCASRPAGSGPCPRGARAVWPPEPTGRALLRLAHRAAGGRESPGRCPDRSVLSALQRGPSGVSSTRCRRRRAGRGSRRRPRSPCARGPPRAARAPAATSASTTPAAGRRAAASPAQCGRAGRGRGRRASRAPRRARRATASSSPAASAALPSRTALCTTASACGTPRSSSIAAAKSRGTRRGPAASRRPARRRAATKPSIRR